MNWGVRTTTIPSVGPRLAEAVVAEKFEAMIQRGMLNTRYKDYFDLRFIAVHFEVDGALVTEAIRTTFTRRQRPLPTDLPDGLNDGFAEASGKPVQWAAFCRKSQVPEPHAPPAEVVAAVRRSRGRRWRLRPVERRCGAVAPWRAVAADLTAVGACASLPSRL